MTPVVALLSAFGSRRREWLAILGLALVLIPLALFAMVLTRGALTTVTYLGLLALLSLWNASVVLDLLRAAWASCRQRLPLALRLALLSLALPSALLWGLPLDLPGRPKGPLVVAALLALAYTAAQLVVTARRSRRDYFAPIYNLFNLAFLAAFAAAEGGPPPGIGALPYLLAHGVGMFQMINISFAASLAPVFILPSYLPKVKGLRWPGVAEGHGFDGFLRRIPRLRPALHWAAWAVSKASGALVLYSAICLLVLSPLAAAGVVSFWAADPHGLAYPPGPGSALPPRRAPSPTSPGRPPGGGISWAGRCPWPGRQALTTSGST